MKDNTIYQHDTMVEWTPSALKNNKQNNECAEINPKQKHSYWKIFTSIHSLDQLLPYKLIKTPFE